MPLFPEKVCAQMKTETLDTVRWIDLVFLALIIIVAVVAFTGLERIGVLERKIVALKESQCDRIIIENESDQIVYVGLDPDHRGWEW